MGRLHRHARGNGATRRIMFGAPRKTLLQGHSGLQQLGNKLLSHLVRIGGGAIEQAKQIVL
jgi:hypothetical protein